MFMSQELAALQSFLADKKRVMIADENSTASGEPGEISQKLSRQFYNSRP